MPGAGCRVPGARVPGARVPGAGCPGSELAEQDQRPPKLSTFNRANKLN